MKKHADSSSAAGEVTKVVAAVAARRCRRHCEGHRRQRVWVDLSANYDRCRVATLLGSLI